VSACLLAGIGRADCGSSVGGARRWYPDRLEDARSYDQTNSLTGTIECAFVHDDGHAWTLDILAHAARRDPARTYAEVRELAWIYTRDTLQLRAGMDQVFWGVAEFAHVVDVINQSDVLADPFGEAKLGQPLASASLRNPWGNVVAFAMPRFRDRMFPELGDPLRPAPPLHLGAARFESGAARNHLDWALRYAHAVGPVDIGLSHFEGTGRDPIFRTVASDGHPELYALYPQIAQSGLDLQVTIGEWALKLEAARRKTHGREQYAWMTGVERMLAGLAGSAADLTIVLEYSRDQRTPLGVPGFLQDDFALGLRLALNDERTTEGKLGVIVDRKHGSRAWAFELSARVWQQWRLAAEARLFNSVPDADPLRAMRDDGYLDVSITRYF
jgi:hypothetical protein